VRHTLILAALLGCGKAAPAQAPELAEYLYATSGSADVTRVVAGWRLTREEWQRVVTEPYRPLWDDYVAAFDTAEPVLAAQLAARHPILARAHFANDPLMTHDQAITRWALPTLAPARIAERAGRRPEPLDAVFVAVGGKWRAIVGVGAIVRRRVASLDPACARVIDAIDVAGGRCTEAAWGIADAALREDRARFAHACGLATSLCGKPAP